jgi:hypothetical protein
MALLLNTMRYEMNKYNHRSEQEELMAYLDGELPTDTATAAVAHLERCAECQTLAADLRNVSQQLMTWEVESADSPMGTAIIEALEQRERTPARIATANAASRRVGFMTRRWVWAVALVVVCLAAGLSLRLNRNSEIQKSQRETGLAAPRAAADSNGLFHGLGDHGQNSFSLDGQPIADQQSKVFGSNAPAPPAGPVSGRQFDRLQQFAKLQNAPPVRFPDGTSGPMIIRTAALTLTTKDFDKARASLDDVLRRHRGYIGDLNVSTPVGAGRSFTATLRFPADQLDAALADLRKLGRAESESQGGQDVTAQYVDLQARLSNARNTELRLTDILQHRTGTLRDVLAVENEISRVRGEIERMEAERKTLSNQVDFATINATVNEDYQAQLQVVPTSTFGRIHNAAVDGYRTMVEGVVGMILFLFSFGPSLLLWCAILFFPARAVWRKARQAMAR